MKKKSIINELTKEYIDNAKNGIRITCEFTSNPDSVADHLREIWKINSDLKGVNAYWHISVCDTCHSYKGGESYVHLQIIRSQ